MHRIYSPCRMTWCFLNDCPNDRVWHSFSLMETVLLLFPELYLSHIVACHAHLVILLLSFLSHQKLGSQSFSELHSQCLNLGVGWILMGHLYCRQFDSEIPCWVLLEQRPGNLVLGDIISLMGCRKLKAMSRFFPPFNGKGLGKIISSQITLVLL